MIEDLPEIEFKIENVVAVATVEIEDTERIELIQIARKDPEVEYNPERFPGLIMRIENPKATLLIFSTGKMVITGLRIAKHAKGAVSKAIARLKKAKVIVKKPKIEIVNVVASGNLHIRVDLNMAAIIMDYTMYEPEVFPGLIYRMRAPDPKCVFLIFSTGKCVCTGARTRDDVEQAFSRLYSILIELGVNTKIEEEEHLDELTFV